MSSATLGINSLKIEQIGKKVEVPNNDYARLMYYLESVFTVIQYDDLHKLTDYEHYYNLNATEKKMVIDLAKLFNPLIFIDAKIFIINPNLVATGYSNEFYKITDEKIGVHVNEELFIGGRAVKVLKIMACKESWINSNYINPLKNIENEKKRISSGTVTVYYYTDDYTNRVTNNQTYSIVETNFGNCSKNTYCYSCKKNVETETDCCCSCGGCCLCCICCCIFYICLQIGRGKNICPCNVTHKCPNCGTVLGTYDAC